MTVGEDLATKTALENGKSNPSKPKVASSKRGRDLRAAAALARFEVNKEAPGMKDEDLVTDSEAESLVDDEVYIKPEPDDALDLDGSRLVDKKGRGMVKVCGDEDSDNEDAKREFEELRGMESIDRYFKPDGSSKVRREAGGGLVPNGVESSKSRKPIQIDSDEENKHTSKTTSMIKKELLLSPPVPSTSTAKQSNPKASTSTAPSTPSACPICSLENPPLSLTCTVCANVLRPEHVTGSWKFKAEMCKEGLYINAGDVAFCGVCGERKGA